MKSNYNDVVISSYDDLMHNLLDLSTVEEKIKFLGYYFIKYVSFDYCMLELIHLHRNAPYSLVNIIDHELQNNPSYDFKKALRDVYSSLHSLTNNYKKSSLRNNVIYNIISEFYTEHLINKDNFTFTSYVENQILSYVPTFHNGLIKSGSSYDFMIFIRNCLNDIKINNATVIGKDDGTHYWNMVYVNNDIYNLDALMAIKERDGYLKHDNYKVSPSSWFKAKMPAMFVVCPNRVIETIDDRKLLNEIDINTFDMEQESIKRYFLKKSKKI